MAKTNKSQCDFGELFNTGATRRVFTVGELTSQVKRLLEKEVGQVWVTGEASNLRVQSSGHIYFTLKDANAQLNCVLFRGEAAGNREVLEDGRKLIVHGELTVYEPRGQYQLVVRAVELQGLGALQQAFEKLKRKLQAEGLFAPERKRPLPNTRAASVWSLLPPGPRFATCSMLSVGAIRRWKSFSLRAAFRVMALPRKSRRPSGCSTNGHPNTPKLHHSNAPPWI